VIYVCYTQNVVNVDQKPQSSDLYHYFPVVVLHILQV